MASARSMVLPAFNMLIRRHPEYPFASQSGPVGIHSHLVDGAFNIPSTVSDVPFMPICVDFYCEITFHVNRRCDSYARGTFLIISS